MHPGAVGGVERDVARAHQHLAVLRLGHLAVGQLEMLGPEFSGRLFDQQDLAIDDVVHGVSPLDVIVLEAVGSLEAINCTDCALQCDARRCARNSQREHSGKRA